MSSVARFQSKTNEKLICLSEHLRIDVVKLRLGLYGWNRRIHQAPVCDMCQKARFSRHSKRAIFHVSWCSISIKNKWKANLSLGASQHWCCQASIRFVWLELKEHVNGSLRPPLKTPPKMTFSTLRQHNFWTTQSFATKRAHFINVFY